MFIRKFLDQGGCQIGRASLVAINAVILEKGAHPGPSQIRHVRSYQSKTPPQKLYGFGNPLRGHCGLVDFVIGDATLQYSREDLLQPVGSPLK